MLSNINGSARRNRRVLPYVVIAYCLGSVVWSIIIPQSNKADADSHEFRLYSANTKLPTAPEKSDNLNQALSDYIIANYRTPEDYVISKFEDHDIVFIGEFHRIKQNLELVHNLIPRLYESGVYNIGIEDGDYDDQPEIDALTTSDTYDEALARKILFNHYVFWGYQEYADIFKAAWTLNKSLPKGSRKFRVVGLCLKEDWSYVKSEEDCDEPQIMRKVWGKVGYDEFMANTILKEFVDKEEKALIYTGSSHAFTQYRQPIYNEKTKEFVRFVEDRMGTLVHNKIGNRAFNIFLHSSWPNEKGYSELLVYPVDGVIDTLMPTLPPKYRKVGFDTHGTPFGSLRGTTTLWKHGYDNFVLSDFCDGYIYQCALSEYTPVTPIEGFINSNNLEEAKSQSPETRFKKPFITPQDFNEQIANDAKRTMLALTLKATGE